MSLTTSERWTAILGLGFLLWLLSYVLSLFLAPLEVESLLLHQLVHGCMVLLLGGILIVIMLNQLSAPHLRDGIWAGLAWAVLYVGFDFLAHWLVDGMTWLEYGRAFSYMAALPIAACLIVGWFIERKQRQRAQRATMRELAPQHFLRG